MRSDPKEVNVGLRLPKTKVYVRRYVTGISIRVTGAVRFYRGIDTYREHQPTEASKVRTLRVLNSGAHIVGAGHQFFYKFPTL